MYNRIRVATIAVIAALAASTLPSAETLAAAPMVKKSAPGYYRIMLGDFEVTALSDGILPLPVDKLLTNTTPDKVTTALTKYYLKSPVETSVNTSIGDEKRGNMHRPGHCAADFL